MAGQEDQLCSFQAAYGLFAGRKARLAIFQPTDRDLRSGFVP